MRAANHYVLGLLFRVCKTKEIIPPFVPGLGDIEVVLIHKEHGPEYVVGLYNGVGGKVDPDELERQAMIRECEQECGVVTDHQDWHKFGRMGRGDGWEVVLCAAWLPEGQEPITKTDERIEVWTLAELVRRSDECVPNLPALVFAALHALQHWDGNPKDRVQFSLKYGWETPAESKSRIHAEPMLQAGEVIETRADVLRFFHALYSGGLSFHPDTPFSDYVDQAGRRCFNAEDAGALDEVMGRCFGIGVDPYEVGVEVLGEPGPAAPPPIPMVLFCPVCHHQHIDRPEPENKWSNPPHRSHWCRSCGHVWRPADVPTTGVACIQTRGKDDDPIPLPPQIEADLRRHIEEGS